MTEQRYEIVLTPPARRAITADLPEAVAAAVIEFVTTALLDNPHRVGKPLRDDLDGIWSARRGTYRVLHRIREDTREVVVRALTTDVMPTDRHPSARLVQAHLGLRRCPIPC